jgi:sec-independent protein translocase protein TatB
MFDISWSELLLIAVVALVFIGPKELPGVLRTVGQWTGKIRRMASEFQDQFREAIREAEVADLKKDIDEATSNLKTGLDPFAGINESTTEWKHSEPTASAPPAADAPPAPPAEATVPVAAETTPTEPAPAPAAPAPAQPAAAEPTAPTAPAPASGGQAA